MGWFDDKKNSTGAIVARLSNDAGQVEGVIIIFQPSYMYMSHSVLGKHPPEYAPMYVPTIARPYAFCSCTVTIRLVEIINIAGLTILSSLCRWKQMQGT